MYKSPLTRDLHSRAIIRTDENRVTPPSSQPILLVLHTDQSRKRDRTRNGTQDPSERELLPIRQALRLRYTHGTGWTQHETANVWGRHILSRRPSRWYSDHATMRPAYVAICGRPCTRRNLWMSIYGHISDSPARRNSPRTGELLPTSLRWNLSISPDHDSASGGIKYFRLSKQILYR